MSHEHEHEHNHNHNESCGCHEHCSSCEHGKLNIEINCCDGCSHSHSAKEEGHLGKLKIAFIAASAVLLILGLLPMFSQTAVVIFFVASAIMSGYELIPEAIEGLKNKKMDENLLVLIAIIAAFAIGEGFEAAAVSLFFRIGENVEDYAVERSKKAIEKLYEITTDFATVEKADGTTVEIPSDDIKVDDIIVVSPFGKIPVDCVAISDGGTVDTSAITGESIPVEITKGMKLLSGSVNGGAVIRLKATAEFKNSAASKIIETVESSQKAKGDTDKFITRFAAIYTPVVVVLAVLIAVIPSIITGQWTTYIYRALVFLVASCPCALVLSVPLGFFAAIGAQSKKGIIVKGGKYIEKLSKVSAVIFDKTGTLTSDEFEIEKIQAVNGYSEKDVIELAAHAEKFSTHPLGKAIREKYGEIDERNIESFTEVSGNGTRIIYLGREVLCGSDKFMAANGIDTNGVEGAQIYLSDNGKLVGAVTLVGKLRETSAKTVKELFLLGIKRVVMLTGDNLTAAQKTADKCGIKEFKAGLLPEEKTQLLQEIRDDGFSPAFVGDGINDTPTLVSADVGIAMGSGSAAAIEVGDVVLMNSNPTNIVNSIKMAKQGMAVIKENIWFAIIVKAAVLVLGAIGEAPMWAAVFADVGVCIIAVLNSARLLMVKKD